MLNGPNCPFEIWAPDHRSHVVNTAFSCFAMESEGDLPTRRGKIEKVIKILAVAANPDDFATQCAAYNEADIDSDTFTDTEIEYIITEVRRKRCYI